MTLNWQALLEALGFQPVAEVRKSRRKAKIAWQGREVEGSLDEVEGVGSYFELELIAEADGIEAAKSCLSFRWPNTLASKKPNGEAIWN